MNSQDNETPSTSRKLINSTVIQEINIDNVADFSNVCRICATVTEFIIPIFSGEGLQNNLSDKINKHLPIKVSEQDVLPCVVCFQCASTVLAWHELVKCCLQADSALRTRLPAPAVANQIPTSSNNTTSQNVEVKPQNKSEEISGLLQTRDPPSYVNSNAGASSERIILCKYCHLEFHESTLKEHLVAIHAGCLFHCENCDTYIDKRIFFSHMSHHAMQYENGVDDKTKNIKTIKEDVGGSNEVEPLQNVTVQETKPVINNGNMNSNEFSDRSDTEDGFDPLPESVFDAIEDSQDNQANIEPNYNQTNNEQTTNNGVSIKPKTKVKSHNKTRTCPICDKVFTASSSFFYHMKHFHKKSKDHECDVCGKKFATKANLVQHSYTHTGECRYQCKTCGKRFKSKASQYIHEQTHSGVKKHACDHCNVSFRWKTHLTRHVKRHSGEKSHVCSTCGRGFNIRGDLLRHSRTHTAGSFACNKCGLKFAQQRYLKVHVLKKHSTSLKN